MEEKAQTDNEAVLTKSFVSELHGACCVEYLAKKEKENIFGIGLSLWLEDRSRMLDSVYFEAVVDKEDKANFIIRLLAKNCVTPVTAATIIDELFCPYHAHYHSVAASS